jgi:hypothetical protein
MSDNNISSITITPWDNESDLLNTGTIMLDSTMHSWGNQGLGTISISDLTANSGNLTIGGSSIYGNSLLNPYSNHGALKVEGPAEINGSLKVNGVDISETLEKINQRLAILKPNPELESRWERLKALGEEYRALEKDILEQEKVYEILKK